MRMYVKKIGRLISYVFALLLFCGVFGCKTECPEKEIDMGVVDDMIITTGEAEDMSKRFVNDIRMLQKLASSSDNPDVVPNFKLAASSHYTLEELEGYIEFAKRESEKQGYTVDGFRFYFGVYPEKGEKANYLTMFIAPTGYPNVQQGGFSPFYFTGDIPNVPPGNDGGLGDPPSGPYPQ